MPTPHDLPNLGPVSREWLAAVGVHSLADLQRIGSVEAYLAVRSLGVRPSLNLLYSLEAAIEGVHWQKLSPATKSRLRKSVGA